MKNKVLHIIDGFQRGGSEGQALQLAMGQVMRSEDIIYLGSLRDDGELRSMALNQGFSSIWKFSFPSFYSLAFIQALFRCSRLFRREGINIVHTHGFYSNIFGMIAATLAKTPVRIASKRETVGIRTKAQWFVEKTCFRLADAIVVNAEAVRQTFPSGRRWSEKIVVIPNAVGPSLVEIGGSDSRSGEREAGHPEFLSEGPMVTMVANFHLLVKDHSTFLRAAKIVVRSVPKARFLLLGSGSYRKARIAEAEELGLEQHVAFLGDRADVMDILAASSVCVQSSRSEGLSNSILEYMYAAKPVVITDVGAAREVVHDGFSGYIVPAGDSELMAARIVSLLSDKTLALRMGRNARETVLAKFSLKSRLDKTQDLYRNLIAGTQIPA